ncbi:MAG: alpha/beta hydrolase [Gammaproteobacteria bacterium]|nr:alpha/beta hydrolase [Gammaproteobacteria bacterium]
MKKIIFILMLLITLGACSTSPEYIPQTDRLEIGHLPIPDKKVTINSLGNCTDSNDQTLHFNTNEPITILVHGCNGSAGRFRSLAELFAFHGQQAFCFSYDDRDSLVDSSEKLITALNELSKKVENKNISVIGHSMGGLVARHAMETQYEDNWLDKSVDLKLVTVSAPLGGMTVAKPCGNKLLHWLSFGFVPAACWAVTGDNWYEITPQSGFIQNPVALMSSVDSYIKIVTDERQSCRRKNDKDNCIEDDYVFSLPEQYNIKVDQYTNIQNIEVKAGHVEIVGYKGYAPHKLLSILQNTGVLRNTAEEQKAALHRLLADLY